MNPNPRRIGGRGGGSFAPPARQPMPTVPISLAKQAKSSEERLYSRFRELQPIAVRVTRYQNGSIVEEVLLNKPDKSGDAQWITTVQAETILRLQQAASALTRARLRAPVRLGRELPSDQSIQDLPDLEQRILFMSQKEWNNHSFRVQGLQTGVQKPPGEAKASPTAEPKGSA